MNEQELERYLEINRILSHHKIEVNESGLMSCPFHPNTEKNMKLYEELNGVACMKKSCSNYRKLFAAFEIMKKLQGVEKEEALSYGKKLLLEELELLRGEKEVIEESPKTIEYIGLSEGGKEFLEELKKYMEESSQKIFTSKEVGKYFRIARSTLKKYLQQFRTNELIEIRGGDQYNGYDYALISS
jgi:hypothetical protein